MTGTPALEEYKAPATSTTPTSTTLATRAPVPSQQAMSSPAAAVPAPIQASEPLPARPATRAHKRKVAENSLVPTITGVPREVPSASRPVVPQADNQNPKITSIPPIKSPLSQVQATSGTPAERRLAWGYLTAGVSQDVFAKMTQKPKIGDLVGLWLAIQNCFFRATAISKNAVKSKLYALTCLSAGGPEKFVSTLQDYFEILKRAGSPVEDQDKVFHFLKGLPWSSSRLKLLLMSWTQPGIRKRSKTLYEASKRTYK